MIYDYEYFLGDTFAISSCGDSLLYPAIISICLRYEDVIHFTLPQICCVCVQYYLAV